MTSSLHPPPTLLHAFFLGLGLPPLSLFPSGNRKTTDAATSSDPSHASPAPLQPKRRRRRLKAILRSIPMPPERAALPVATPPSEYPPFSILSLLMILPPQPRGFCRSQSGIAGCSRRAQRRTLSLDAPMRSDTPPRLRLTHALPDDNTPRDLRGTTAASSQLPWRHPAACPDPFAQALLDDTPRSNVTGVR